MLGIRTLRWALFARLFLFGLTAQTPDTAVLNGRAVDASNAGIGGVAVTVRNTQTGLERKAITDATGGFTVEGLPVAGKYTVTAAKTGFADSSVEGVSLAGGTSAGIVLELSVAGGKTAVTVTGAAGGVRADAPQIGNY